MLVGIIDVYIMIVKWYFFLEEKEKRKRKKEERERLKKVKERRKKLKYLLWISYVFGVGIYISILEFKVVV